MLVSALYAELGAELLEIVGIVIVVIEAPPLLHPHPTPIHFQTPSLQHTFTMSSFRPNSQAPKGYIPGLGRGAAGFVTASDVSDR